MSARTATILSVSALAISASALAVVLVALTAERLATPTEDGPGTHTESVVEEAISGHDREGRAATVVHHTDPENIDEDWHVSDGHRLGPDGSDRDDVVATTSGQTVAVAASAGDTQGTSRSASRSGTVPCCQVPAKPGTPLLSFNPRAGLNPTFAGSLLLSPDDNGARIIGYEWQLTGPSPLTVVTTDADSFGTSFQTGAGRLLGGGYRVRVRARNINGYGPWSDYSYQKTRPGTVPGPVKNLRAERQAHLDDSEYWVFDITWDWPDNFGGYALTWEVEVNDRWFDCSNLAQSLGNCNSPYVRTGAPSSLSTTYVAVRTSNTVGPGFAIGLDVEK